MRLKIRSVVVIALAAVALGVSLQAAETKYGAGVTLTSATPIKDLYASPDKFVGKTVRVDGVVTAVCTVGPRQSQASQHSQRSHSATTR